MSHCQHQRNDASNNTFEVAQFVPHVDDATSTDPMLRNILPQQRVSTIGREGKGKQSIKETLFGERHVIKK